MYCTYYYRLNTIVFCSDGIALSILHALPPFNYVYQFVKSTSLTFDELQ